MNESVPVAKNREALKRIVAMLIGMTGMAVGTARGTGAGAGTGQYAGAVPGASTAAGAGTGAGKQSALFPRKNVAALSRALAAKTGRSPALILPRHLQRFVLKMLRPVEAAVRRLIIAASLRLVVTLPPVRPRKPKPKPIAPVLRSLGIAVVMSGADLRRIELARRAAALSASRRKPSLPLFDPLKPWHVRPWRAGSGSMPFRSLPPGDAVDATRIARRLEALSAALDDLPGQAKRFARWRARHMAKRAKTRPDGEAGIAHRDGEIVIPKFTRAAKPYPAAKPLRASRNWPLKPGRPPGCRLSRYDPTARHGSNIREIDEILAHCHALAVYALETPDTS